MSEETNAAELKRPSSAELGAYLASRRILIVDPGNYSGRALQRILLQLGARNGEVRVYRTQAEASEALASLRPHILIAEISLHDRSSLELFKVHSFQNPSRLEVASLALCSEAPGTTLGAIAAADVDAVLLKPMTLKGVRETLLNVLAERIHPSPYWTALEKGKELLQKTELGEALKKFEEARTFQPNSALSYYYLGKVRQEQKQADAAAQCFEAGLAVDPVDYRCLSAFFELRMEQSEHTKAYALARKIVENYPVDTARLSEFIRLGVRVGRFEDMPIYYNAIDGSKEGDFELARVVIAALLVAAKSFYWKTDLGRARDTLVRASRLAARHSVFLAETLRYMIETSNLVEAMAFHASLPKDIVGLPSVELLQLEIFHGMELSIETIRLAVARIGAGRGDERTFDILFENSVRSNRPESVIARLIDQAEELCPHVDWRARIQQMTKSSAKSEKATSPAPRAR